MTLNRSAARSRQQEARSSYQFHGPLTASRVGRLGGGQAGPQSQPGYGVYTGELPGVYTAERSPGPPERGREQDQADDPPQPGHHRSPPGAPANRAPPTAPPIAITTPWVAWPIESLAVTPIDAGASG